MVHALLQPTLAWAEDRATQRCDPSAVPGAKTGAGAGHSLAPFPSLPLRDWHQSDKPSRHDAATLLAGRPSQLANFKRQEFQFPVNQDNRDSTCSPDTQLGLR
jgi:hypothetical protein